MLIILVDLLYNFQKVSDLCFEIDCVPSFKPRNSQGLYILRYRNNLDKGCYETRFLCFADDITDILLTFAILLQTFMSKMFPDANKKIKLYSSALSIINIGWF